MHLDYRPISVLAKAGNFMSTFENEVSFQIIPGKVNVIYGPSGRGKTTLLKSLLGLSDGFSISLCRALPDKKYYIAQADFIFPGTLVNNLFMDEVNNISVAQLDGARRLLEYMHLEHLDLTDDDTSVHQRLSGGEKRRLSIARAFLANSDVLYLDEPTSGLDAETEDLLFDLFERHAKRVLIIMVSHADLSKRDELNYNMVRI